jgi:hypothetical protein
MHTLKADSWTNITISQNSDRFQIDKAWKNARASDEWIANSGNKAISFPSATLPVLSTRLM